MISKCDNLRATTVPLLPSLKFTVCLGRLTQTRLSSGKHVIFESGYGLTHRGVSVAQWKSVRGLRFDASAAHNKNTKKASLFVHVFSSFKFVCSFSGTNQPDNQ